jgi:hypothetical protein
LIEVIEGVFYGNEDRAKVFFFEGTINGNYFGIVNYIEVLLMVSEIIKGKVK